MTNPGAYGRHCVVIGEGEPPPVHPDRRWRGEVASIKGKRLRAAHEVVDSTKRYEIDEGVELVKKFASAKFDESVDLSVRLGVNPRQADQMVRGALSLPHGTGKSVVVVVFADGEAAAAATSRVEFARRANHQQNL